MGKTYKDRRDTPRSRKDNKVKRKRLKNKEKWETEVSEHYDRKASK